MQEPVVREGLTPSPNKEWQGILLHQLDELEQRINTELRFQNPLPPEWDANREKRIERSQEDFFYFCKEYFPGKWFTAPFSSKHKKMFNDADRRDGRCCIYAAPRRFGKTTLFRIFKVWVAIFGKRHFYGKVSDTLPLAVKDLKITMNNFLYNKKIISDFGELIDPSWHSAHSFHVLPNKYNHDGTYFEAFSTTVTARGELRDTRLDFLEFDDYEDYSTSINPDISKEKIEILERDFLPALSEDGAAIWIGNNARTTCAINILASMQPRELNMLHPSIEINIIPAWDEKKNRATWHERYKQTTEEELRLAFGMSITVWKGECQQQPSPPEGSRFLLEHWIKYILFPSDAIGIMFCDPSYGTKSAYKAIALLFWSKSQRRFLSPAVFCRRCGWEEYFLAMYSLYEQYRKHILYIGWEGNFGQAQYLQFQETFASVKSRPRLPIRIINVEGEKHYRISKLETPYAMGNIWFAPEFLHTPDGIEAQSQLIGYEGKADAQHQVDFPDALSSAYELVWGISLNKKDSGKQHLRGDRRRYSKRY